MQAAAQRSQEGSGIGVVRPREVQTRDRFENPSRGTGALVPAPASLSLANLPPGLEGKDTLLAVRGGSILAIRSYRIEGDRLVYRNVMGGENTMALASVDMERTQRLNTDRKVPFGAR